MTGRRLGSCLLPAWNATSERWRLAPSTMLSRSTASGITACGRHSPRTKYPANAPTAQPGSPAPTLPSRTPRRTTAGSSTTASLFRWPPDRHRDPQARPARAFSVNLPMNLEDVSRATSSPIILDLLPQGCQRKRIAERSGLHPDDNVRTKESFLAERTFAQTRGGGPYCGGQTH